jgi:ribosomal protein S18 acetylase RimI-like enzyme
VQTSNASAVRFYENNQFKIAETLENYYTDNIVPPHAYVMLKNFD